MVISGFQELKTQLREAAPQPAVVAAAHDEHTLEAVFQARRDGLISPILVGRRGAHPLHRPLPGGGTSRRRRWCRPAARRSAPSAPWT